LYRAHFLAMSETNEVTSALFALLREMNAVPSGPISLYEIGPPLISKGYTQDQILNILFFHNGKEIELIPGNRLRVISLFKAATSKRARNLSTSISSSIVDFFIKMWCEASFDKAFRSE
jgi:hypothetical protein